MVAFIDNIRFLLSDWWKSRHEARQTSSGLARTLRDASFSGSSRGAVAPSEEILQQAADGHEQYRKSFD